LSAKIIPIGNTIRRAGDLGNVVRIARKRQKLTQAELAERAGVGLRFLSELENGKPTVQLRRTMQVLAALGLTLGVYDQQVRLK
jgi:HTH-type transcriptional regulator / antitoxin HipB